MSKYRIFAWDEVNQPSFDTFQEAIDYLKSNCTHRLVCNYDPGFDQQAEISLYEGKFILHLIDVEYSNSTPIKPMLEFFARETPEMLLEALKSNPEMVDPVTGLLRLK